MDDESLVGRNRLNRAELIDSDEKATDFVLVAFFS